MLIFFVNRRRLPAVGSRAAQPPAAESRQGSPGNGGEKKRDMA